MEKLIELLNESAVLDTIFENEYQVKFSATKIISKELGFIKWLVDNDKIDFSREGEYCTKSIEEFDGLLRDDEDGLIMILAISETPIDDLVSYLK